MRRQSFVAAALLSLISVSAIQTSARADAPVADPGFSFVDVNNDGLYSATSGDIGLGSSPSVDIDALIANDGYFNTQRNEGDYHASCNSVSLVIPASQSASAAGTLTLKAGKNIIVRGSLTADKISLYAGKSVDLSKSLDTFNTSMYVDANDDVYLDAASISGIDPASQFTVSADDDIFARPDATTGLVTVIAAGANITLDGNGTVAMEGAILATADPLSTVNIYGDYGIDADTGNAIMAGDLVLMKTSKASIKWQTSTISANRIQLEASDSCSGGGRCNGYNQQCRSHNSRSSNHGGCGNHGGCRNNCYGGGGHSNVVKGNIDVTDSILTANASIIINGCKDVTGATANTNLFGGSVDVNTNGNIFFGAASIAAGVGAVNMTTDEGKISLPGAIIFANDGFKAASYGDMDLTLAVIAANKWAKMSSSYGAITGNSSIGTAGDTAMFIEAIGKKNLYIDGSSWQAPASIYIKSSSYDIYARNGSFLAGTTLKFYAGGKDAHVEGSTLSPATYGPNGVRVYGP
jgi:hypothetical protein